MITQRPVAPDVTEALKQFTRNGQQLTRIRDVARCCFVNGAQSVRTVPVHQIMTVASVGDDPPAATFRTAAAADEPRVGFGATSSCK